jgi:hypothetical protein
LGGGGGGGEEYGIIMSESRLSVYGCLSAYGGSVNSDIQVVYLVVRLSFCSKT